MPLQNVLSTATSAEDEKRLKELENRVHYAKILKIEIVTSATLAPGCVLTINC
jgi:hypothetical protein